MGVHDTLPHKHNAYKDALDIVRNRRFSPVKVLVYGFTSGLTSGLSELCSSGDRVIIASLKGITTDTNVVSNLLINPCQAFEEGYFDHSAFDIIIWDTVCDKTGVRLPEDFVQDCERKMPEGRVIAITNVHPTLPMHYKYAMSSLMSHKHWRTTYGEEYPTAYLITPPKPE